MSSGKGSAAAVSMLLIVIAACSGHSQLERAGQTEQTWNSEAGSLRLERVIGSNRDLGKGRGLGWLKENRDNPIFSRPYGVTWANDDLIITDPTAGRVLRLDARGRVTKSPRGAFESPIGVAVCAAGIVVSDSRRGTLEILDAGLHSQRRIAVDLDRPTGVECLGERLFVAETGRHRILVFSVSPQAKPSEALEIWGSRGAEIGEFNFPTALALEADSLWVADTLNFRVQRLNPETGAFLDSWGTLGDAAGELPRIKDVAIGVGRNLWISDAHLNQLAVFDRDGEFLLSVGTPGHSPGQFSFPAGLAAHPDGRIAVVDSLNRRLQIFRWTPAPPAPGPLDDQQNPGGGS